MLIKSFEESICCWFYSICSEIVVICYDCSILNLDMLGFKQTFKILFTNYIHKFYYWAFWIESVKNGLIWSYAEAMYILIKLCKFIIYFFNHNFLI